MTFINNPVSCLTMKTYHTTTLAAHALLVSTLTPEGYTVQPLQYFEGGSPYPNPSVTVKKGNVSFWVNLPSPNSYNNRDRIIVKPDFSKLRDHLPYAYSHGDKSVELNKFSLAHSAAPARLLKRFNTALADYLPAFTEMLENKRKSDERANATINEKLSLLEADILDLQYVTDKSEYVKSSEMFYLNTHDEYSARLIVHGAYSMTLEIGKLDAEKVIKIANFLKTL